MKLAIMTTLFRRDMLLWENCCRGIQRTFPKVPVHMVIDEEPCPEKAAYVACMDRHDLRGTIICESSLTRFPDTYHLDGYKNPAGAWNRCLDSIADSEITHVLLLSSDVILPVNMGQAINDFDLDKCLYTPRVINSDDFQLFCAVEKVWPLPWALVTRLDWLRNIGGWDMEFRHGMACEDNDLVARLAVEAGYLVIDNRVSALHQSHEQVAYSDGHKGWNTNKEYTKKKWGGAEPFSNTHTPIRITKEIAGDGFGVWRLSRA